MDPKQLRPVRIVAPGEPTRSFDETKRTHVTTQAEPVELLSTLGSVQAWHVQASDVMTGAIAGKLEAVPTHRAYLLNTPEIREAILTPGACLIDDNPLAPTYGKTLEIMKPARPMAAVGPLRLELREV